jgi:AAA ATPase domain
VNVAARLEQAAGGGEILVGPDTYRLVRHAIEAEAVEPLTLKGKSERVPAFRLVRLLDEDPAARRLDTTLIGREEELDRLDRALEQAIADRRAALITVVGGAGVGKSRLGHEFVRQVGDRARVLHGHCVAYGEGITFWPVAEILRQSAEITENDGPAETRAKLASALAGSEDATAVADRLAGLLGFGTASPHQEETFWALARFLESHAADRPLLVIFDDVHWAEPSFLDLLEYLEHREADAPILIAAFARPELRELRRHMVGGTSSIVLEPFGGEAIARLIESRVGGELPAAVAERITETAEGNPLFVEEMLQMLIDDGYLQREDGGWTLAKDLDEKTVPPTIEALLGARLDRLRDSERDVAQRASVAGKVFPRGALSELSPDRIRPELGVYLDSLLQKDFLDLDDSPEWEDESYRFHHVLIRDAAYRSMLKERRAELHERFADWLTARTGRAEAEHEELVGYHLEQAYRLLERLGPVGERGRELAKRAGRALASSSRGAFAHGDMPASATLAERALALIPDGDAGRSDLGLLLSSALLETGDAAQAADALERADSDAAGDRLQEAHCAVQRAYLRLFTDPEADHAELAAVADQAIPVFEQADDQLGLARAWRIWSSQSWSEGRVAEATIALTRSFEHAQASGDAHEEAETFQWLLVAHHAGPTTVDEGVEMCKAFADDRRARDRSGYAALLIVQGAFEMLRGDVEHGRSLYQQGQQIFHELGQRHKAAVGALIAADAEMQGGEAGRAEALLRPAIDTLLELEDSSYTTEAAALLSGALFAQGNVEEAARFASISEDSAIKNDIIQMGTWRIVRALVLVAEGKADDAERLAREAVELLADCDSPSLRAEAGLTLTGVLMAQEKGEDAAPFVEDALAAYEEKGNVLGAKRANELLAGVAG